MDFGEALKIVKNGGMIQRTGWNGKDLFVFRQVPAQIPVESVVPNMQSLPGLVKSEFARRLEHRHFHTLFYHDQLALVDFDNNITGWSPSTADSLADDWEIYHPLDGDVA